MAFEREVQNFVHSLEEGRWAAWIKISAVAFLCLMATVIVVFDPFFWGVFKGLSHPKAMEQAVIARELARGNGFSTLMWRPIELAHWLEADTPPPANLPATYQAPLWPATLAPVLWAVKSKWQMTPSTYIYLCDKLIAVVGLLFFYASIIVNYMTIRRLFDQKLAWISACLLLLCGLLWSLAVSGLQHMELFFLFSLALYTLLRAVENRIAGAPPIRWLAASAALFGLLTLAHGLMVWLFLGCLVFTGFYFRRRWVVLPMMIGIFLLFYGPWLVRNEIVSGNPLGSSAYSLLFQVRGSEPEIMRASAPPSIPSPFAFRPKVQSGISGILSHIVGSMGGIVVAPVFFIALLHLFKRRETAVFRWLLLSMWAFGSVGMALIGSDDLGAPVRANDIQFLFIPLFAAYGFAFALVMWNRLDLKIPLARNLYIGGIFFFCALPFVNFFLGSGKVPFNWPPYAPPYISFLNVWTEKNEIVASDMPWAVAWYADRRSLWIPNSLSKFIDYHDYGRLGAPIAGVYLTPVSGDRSLLSDILKGEYKDWAPLILRSTSMERFPFPKSVPMPINNLCIFYSDYDRWSASLK